VVQNSSITLTSLQNWLLCICPHQRHKPQNHCEISRRCTLIGYTSNAKAYRCWFRESGQIVDSFHITFVEHLNNQTPELSPSIGMNTAPNMGENVAALPPAIQLLGVQKQKLTQQNLRPLPRQRRVCLQMLQETLPRRQQKILIFSTMLVFLVDVEDPDAPSWAEALESDQCNKWLEAAEAELNSLCKMKVYELVSHHKVPANCSAASSYAI
jgi:hypothetical protein